MSDRHDNDHDKERRGEEAHEDAPAETSDQGGAADAARSEASEEAAAKDRGQATSGAEAGAPDIEEASGEEEDAAGEPAMTDNAAESGPSMAGDEAPDPGGRAPAESGTEGEADAEDGPESGVLEPRPPEAPPSVSLVGVKFRRAGKTYQFDCAELRFSIGEQVIVETDRGLGMARVVTPVVELPRNKAPKEVKRVIRKANWNDHERDRKNKEREQEAFSYCTRKIRQRNLNMKLVRVEYYHDASKAIFYFTAEQRVDFRELVKDLARNLHTRIEMRQIGVRDEAKMCGGLGPCGRAVCCATFLSNFSPVSVRMAKDQNLAMNPAKVSGLCGRLMCCLAYEHQLYTENIKGMPKKGKRMASRQGLCRVVDLNILARQVLVELESGKSVFVSADDLVHPDRAHELEPEEPEAPDAEELDDAVLDSDDPRAIDGGGRRNAGKGQRLDRSAGPAPDKDAGRGKHDQGRSRKQDQRQGRKRGRPDRRGKSDRGARGPKPEQGESGDRRGPAPPAGSRPYKSKDGPPRAPAGSRPFKKDSRPEKKQDDGGRGQKPRGQDRGGQPRPDRRSETGNSRPPGGDAGNASPSGAPPKGGAQGQGAAPDGGKQSEQSENQKPKSGASRGKRRRRRRKKP